MKNKGKFSLGAAIAIGIGVGTAIGVATDNIPAGLTVGAIFGIAIWAWKKRKK